MIKYGIKALQFKIEFFSFLYLRKLRFASQENNKVHISKGIENEKTKEDVKSKTNSITQTKPKSNPKQSKNPAKAKTHEIMMKYWGVFLK